MRRNLSLTRFSDRPGRNTLVGASSRLNAAVEQFHGLEPWKQNDEAAELIRYRDELKGGEALYSNEPEDVRIQVRVGDLVDYSGELRGH